MCVLRGGRSLGEKQSFSSPTGAHRGQAASRLLWSESLAWAHHAVPAGICEADCECRCRACHESSSSLGNSCCCFKRSPSSAECWSQDSTCHFPPQLRNQGENELLRVPLDSLSQLALFPVPAASYCLDTEVWLQAEETPLPHGCSGRKLRVHYKHRE